MKKSIILSIIASGIMYAGGDIAPAQPVQPAAAPAACNFWGTLALRYDAIKSDNSNATNGITGLNFQNKWDKDSDAVAALAMGVKKELGNGFGIGAELGAFYTLDGKLNKVSESAEISQAYLTYKAGNTAIKVGRQALPQNLSPWAWSDRTAGVLDLAYNGVVVVNTDLPDTVIAGAWIASVTPDTNNVKIDSANGTDKGLYALAVEYKGIANTTIDATAYYVPKFLNTNDKAYSIWASVQTKASSFDLGLQAAYVKADGLGNGDATFAVAGYVGTKYENLEAKLTLGYINDGNAFLNLTGAAQNIGSVSSSFWATFADDDSNVAFGGEINKGKQTVAKLDLGYKLPYGKLLATIGYDKSTGNGRKFDSKVGAKVGYEFDIKGVDTLIEYSYVKTNGVTSAGDSKIQRVRVQGVYKF